MDNSEVELKGASQDAIQYHYDKGNNFYKLWLDENMVYSSALWEEGDTLESAQIRKLDYHIQNAHAQNAKHILDIGCGWGSLLERLTSHYNAESGVGLTLSQEQVNWVDNLQIPGIDTRLENWQDHQAEKKYDAIISIGAFEHFAKQDLSEADRIEGYRDFFRKCHEWLNDGCYLSLQTIGCGNMTRDQFSEFFATEIFPESDLPRLSEICAASEHLFEITSVRNDRLHYAKTLKQWLKRLRSHKAMVIDTYGLELYKRYEKYFQLAILSFEHFGTMDLYRIGFRRNKEPKVL
jgi:cyclopropane-fatty-acyl-phospholipid synthase